MNILLLGSNGQLGQELERQLSSVGNVVAFPRSSLDITNHTAVKEVIHCVRPNVIVNAAAYTAVDQAEQDSDTAFAVNAEAVAHLAQLAKAEHAWLIHYSTDYVFDGTKSTPYTEADTPNPINVYGASKLAGEQAIAKADGQNLIFRTTWALSNHSRSFALKIIDKALNECDIAVVSDQTGVPTSTGLVAKVTIDACKSISRNSAWPDGIYHLVPTGVSNWYEIAQTILSICEHQQIHLKAKATDIRAITTNEYPTTAMRPLNSLLDTSKLRTQLSFDLPHWKEDFQAVASKIVKKLQTT